MDQPEGVGAMKRRHTLSDTQVWALRFLDTQTDPVPADAIKPVDLLHGVVIPRPSDAVFATLEKNGLIRRWHGTPETGRPRALWAITEEGRALVATDAEHRREGDAAYWRQRALAAEAARNAAWAGATAARDQLERVESDVRRAREGLLNHFGRAGAVK